MKRFAVLMLCAFLLLAGAAPARAMEDAVEDLAYVLSPDLVSQVRQLDDWLHNSLGLRLHIITRDFLGGTDAQVYVDELLALKHGEGSIIFLMVIGEERYALALGSKAATLVDGNRAEKLLNDVFREPFLKARDYDRALATLLTRAGDQLAAAAGVPLQRDDLFEGLDQQITVPQAATPTPQRKLRRIDLTQFDNSIITDPISPTQDPTSARERARRQETGLSFGSVVVIGFVLYLVFGRKGRQDGRGRGCGCGPLGWIVGALGLSRLFGWRK